MNRNVDILDDDDGGKALEDIEQTIQTNLTGLIHCTQKAYRLMQKSGENGIIINIASVTGHGVPVLDSKWNVYPGTKHAVRATTEVIRQELVKKNNNKIRVSEISPGTVSTELFEAGGFGKSGKPGWIKAQGYPSLKDSDISQAVLFLLMTPDSVNITEIIIKPTGESF
jgi:NADP+-dependent farnesol dehydrogenase